MSVSSRYWQIVKIDAAGRRQVREITPAREFFTDLFPTIANKVDDVGVDVDIDVEDASIQSVLLPLSRNTHSDRYFLAERCLLCFISWQIEQACLQPQKTFLFSEVFNNGYNNKYNYMFLWFNKFTNVYFTNCDIITLVFTFCNIVDLLYIGDLG
jgi:hypothetical protein